LEEPGVDERIILKWIFERLDGGHRLDSSGSGKGHGDEPSGSIKYGDILSNLERFSFSGRTAPWS
jgi:hypothetical protein